MFEHAPRWNGAFIYKHIPHPPTHSTADFLPDCFFTSTPSIGHLSDSKIARFVLIAPFIRLLPLEDKWQAGQQGRSGQGKQRGGGLGGCQAFPMRMQKMKSS